MAKGRSINDLMDVMIYVVFAGVIVPIIGTQMSSLEGDTGNYSASEILIFGVITTLVIVGVAYAIIKKLF